MTRRIILSRKGFDSENGGIASPVLIDGTMLSLPIPNCSEKVKYNELFFKELSYNKIINQLCESFEHEHCHVDPDIYKHIFNSRSDNWKACFGQVGAAQSHLTSKRVSEGDIFLFFG